MKIVHIFAAGAAIAGMAAPAAAQVYGQPYPQPYPQPYQQGYGYQNQNVNPVQQIVDQLLGNRYNVNDRTAVQRCASAALAQAGAQYRQPYGNAYGYQGQGQGYGQQYGYNRQVVAPGMRVTNITQVARVRNGVRVQGLISTGMTNNRYGQPGYGDPRYAQQAGADLSFRCNVDYRGAVTGLRVARYNPYRR
ncbi:hypothetical protein G7078_09105 [Sphingomonas sinipercae]|uniref:Uncharacterized protein n=1 Tax=Sphingomonas sinipercae TaxID=2714944 RepID=A0A6G7ZPL2_9SPHN|nr:hypothetical protein [Sphingomonas sinipercae]QIL02924.1 hypothetical protein G7078_09105 [Sphingomonas sinipercae]